MPYLLTVIGVPGSGKSTVIRHVRSVINCAYVDTDECWKHLYREPKYTPEESCAVFELLHKKTFANLNQGLSTIAEGVFASYARLERLEYLAKSCNVRFCAVGLSCDMPVAFQRMINRQREGGGGPVSKKLWEELHHKINEWVKLREIVWINTQETEALIAANKIIRLLTRQE